MSSSIQSIKFYGPKDGHYEFSNFYSHKNHQLKINGYTWSCVEHYFQAAKFYIPDSPQHIEYFKIIQSTDSPAKMAMLGRQKKRGGYAVKWVINKKTDKRTVNEVIDLYKHLQMRDDWNNARIEVMTQAITVKFSDPKLKKILLDTGDNHIIENSPRDSFWGIAPRAQSIKDAIGKEGDGINMLGKILMEVRSGYR